MSDQPEPFFGNDNDEPLMSREEFERELAGYEAWLADPEAYEEANRLAFDRA